MIKACSICKIEKDISEYYSRKCKRDNAPNRIAAECKKCNHEKYSKRRKEYSKKQSAGKTDVYKKQNRNAQAKKYNISLEEYDKCMASSDNCEICGVFATTKGLSFDHCHETGEFRGILCNKCNMAIGQLGDNIAGLEKALKYLKGKNNE